MSDPSTLFFPSAIGLTLGLFFFGGLWWTVRMGLHAKRPELWFLGSSVVRVSVVLASFAAVGDGHWERLVACLLGFVTARLLLTRWSRRRVAMALVAARERHAPQPR